MSLVQNPMFWVIMVLSLGIPIAVIIGARRLAVRLVGGTGAMPLGSEFQLPYISLHFDSFWHLARTGLMVLIMGTGTGLMLLRFVYGVGPVTNLSDQFPLGLWIGFDVMGGVALAAGAFVIAALAHVFKIERFEPLARPAILTGLLGYLMAVASLLVDLGRPYNVWRPLIHWQHHSALWEVGVCVACYTSVLILEFLPVLLERVNQVKAITDRLPTIPLYRLLKKFSLVFVITGVVLSTMHQSSLGSLWVLVPEKLHPLWYSVRLPILFWISAVAGGFAMTIIEATLSSKAFKRGLELELLQDLARYAAVFLYIYIAAKLADLAARGGLALLTEHSLQAGAFWVELVVGALIPAVLFSIRRLRERAGTLFVGASLIVLFGIVLNRLNVSMIGLYSYTGYVYTPSWMEITVSVTIISFGVLAFGLIAKYLPIFPDEHPAEA